MDILLVGGLWLDTSVWDDVIGPLRERGHRGVPVALPGQDDGDASATLDDQVAAVLAAVDAADGTPWVVGHSAAATLAWLAADARPDRVAGVALIGGFPAADGEPYADLFPVADHAMPFPGWAPFEGPDAADLDDDARRAFESRAVPVPEGVARGVVRLTDERRFDVPVALVCPEFTPDDARDWVASGDLPELARATRLAYVDIDSGHWPMLTKPAELARVLAAVVGAAAEPATGDVAAGEPAERTPPEFVRQDLRGARFRGVDLSGALIRGSDLSGVVMRGIDIKGAEIDSPWLIEEGGPLLVNGVDVVGFVDAELDRRFPGRAQRRAVDPAGLAAAWAALERTWAATLERAAALPPGALDVSVDGEWSFAQTLRHLIMATDTWLRRAILDLPEPYHPLGQPNAGAEQDGLDMSLFATGIPPYEEVLAARSERVAMVRDFIARVTPEQLDEPRRNPWAPQYPETVRSCLHTILEEEWEHHRFAVRDLDAIVARSLA